MISRPVDRIAPGSFSFPESISQSVGTQSRISQKSPTRFHTSAIGLLTIISTTTESTTGREATDGAGACALAPEEMLSESIQMLIKRIDMDMELSPSRLHSLTD